MSTDGLAPKTPPRMSRDGDLRWLGVLLAVVSALLMIGLVWLIFG